MPNPPSLLVPLRRYSRTWKPVVELLREIHVCHVGIVAVAVVLYGKASSR